MKLSALALLLSATLLVSACGSITGDRAKPGAGVAAVVGATTGLSIL